VTTGQPFRGSLSRAHHAHLSAENTGIHDESWCRTSSCAPRFTLRPEFPPIETRLCFVFIRGVVRRATATIEPVARPIFLRSRKNVIDSAANFPFTERNPADPVATADSFPSRCVHGPLPTLPSSKVRASSTPRRHFPRFDVLEDRTVPTLLYSATPVNDLLNTSNIAAANNTDNIAASVSGNIYVAYAGAN